MPDFTAQLAPASSLSARDFGGRFSGDSHGLARQGPANPPPAVIPRLKGEWEDEYQRWQKRALSARRYVCVWADGVYLADGATSRMLWRALYEACPSTRPTP